jgi:hypothetical protein
MIEKVLLNHPLRVLERCVEWVCQLRVLDWEE